MNVRQEKGSSRAQKAILENRELLRKLGNFCCCIGTACRQWPDFMQPGKSFDDSQFNFDTFSIGKFNVFDDILWKSEGGMSSDSIVQLLLYTTSYWSIFVWAKVGRKRQIDRNNDKEALPDHFSGGNRKGNRGNCVVEPLKCTVDRGHQQLSSLTYGRFC